MNLIRIKEVALNESFTFTFVKPNPKIDYLSTFMKILYKHKALIGLRYPYSFLGIVIKLVLLTFFFATTYFLAIGKLNVENWSIAVFFICGILALTMNNKKAVYNGKTNQLTIYRTSFDIKGTKYELPASRDQLTLLTEQRIDYQNANGRKQVLQFTDLWLKLPQENVELDTAATNDSLRGEIKNDWEPFLAAIYDPESRNEIRGTYAFHYWELAVWVVMTLAGIAGLYLN